MDEEYRKVEFQTTPEDRPLVAHFSGKMFELQYGVYDFVYIIIIIDSIIAIIIMIIIISGFLYVARLRILHFLFNLLFFLPTTSFNLLYLPPVLISSFFALCSLEIFDYWRLLIISAFTNNSSFNLILQLIIQKRF